VCCRDADGVGHNIDFHAVTGPGGGASATYAEAGETKVSATYAEAGETKVSATYAEAGETKVSASDC
jgi:hypothetical protein